MIILKINMVATQDYYSLTQTIGSITLKPKMLKMISARIKKCLILVIIRLSQNIMMIQRN